MFSRSVFGKLRKLASVKLPTPTQTRLRQACALNHTLARVPQTIADGQTANETIHNTAEGWCFVSYMPSTNCKIIL